MNTEEKVNKPLGDEHFYQALREMSFHRLGTILSYYDRYISDRIEREKIDFHRNEEEWGAECISEIERLQGIKDDVKVCLQALIDNGSWIA